MATLLVLSIFAQPVDTRFEQSAIGNLKSTQAQRGKSQVIPRHYTRSPLIHHQAASHNAVYGKSNLGGPSRSSAKLYSLLA